MRMCMLTYPAEYIMIHNSSNDDQQRTLQKVNNSVNIIIVLFALLQKGIYSTQRYLFESKYRTMQELL